MNKRIEWDILQYIASGRRGTQRELSEALGYALGSVNQGLQGLQQRNLIDDKRQLTKTAAELLPEYKPRRAVILAAGAGLRMVPINREISKGLLEVHGETLVERLIKQLHEAGIAEIYVVVGFMKEKYEYLIDRYGVELIVNRDYAVYNNLHSLARAEKYIENAYIIPCDLWCEENPFSEYEFYAWYMVGDEPVEESNVVINRKGELAFVNQGKQGSRMVGIAYLDSAAACRVREKLSLFRKNPAYNDSFWEECLYEKRGMAVAGRLTRGKIVEINSYEELRLLDPDSRHLNSDAINLAAEAFHADKREIADIQVLKAGMTNRSFLFSYQGKRYIMRIPGEGTSQMINREQEYKVYQVVQREKLCDDVKYMNPENGYKITAYMENVRNCRADNREDVARCMKYLRDFHEKKLQVAHEFDLFGKIEFYEALWDGDPSVYDDYSDTKRGVMELKAYIDAQEKDRALTHIDAVPDNFLMADGEIRLIDWEYAGMQDPHLDIAMFAVYAMYDREQVETLIDLYFTEGVERNVRMKIYCYIAAAGLLWSNWCEYKRKFGVEFGEYALRQYRYAKEYYRLFRRMSKEEDANE